MPFSGLEFGNMIFKEKGLQNVQIEETSIGDHYDLTEKKVKVGKDRLTKKSLTSIAIISHEIGHAIFAAAFGNNKKAFDNSQDYSTLINMNKFLESRNNFIKYSTNKLRIF